jgi:glycosyltransferase involved in cell wall biosynthesis
MTVQEFRVGIPELEKLTIQKAEICYLSVVIPAKNEETRLPGTLIKLAQTLKPLGIAYETIVVNDGSTDNTAKIAWALGAQVITNTTSKGIAAAFRAGAKTSSGAVVMLCPADIENFEFLKNAISASRAYDVVSVSKRHPKSVVIGYNRWRWFMSNYYHRFVSLLFGKFEDCTDTHYIKLYNGPILRAIADRCIIDGPVGETEIMIHARNVGCTFFEVPAKILHNSHGSKTSFKTILRTATELLRLKVIKP